MMPIKKVPLKNRIIESFSFLKYRLYFNIFRLENPIIIYQMGKVGSSTIRKSLEKNGFKPVFHVHRMNKKNIKELRENHIKKGLNPLNEELGKILYRDFIKSRKKVRLITLVRNPIDRNISAFFQNYEEITLDSHNLNKCNIDNMVKEFLSCYPHEIPLEWFDKELRKTTGINIYEFDFPESKGWKIIKKGNIELLILKIEISDKKIEKAIEEFLDITGFKMFYANIAKEKHYSSIYKKFREEIVLPKELIEKMINSKYMKHFYGKKERIDIKRKWLNNN